MYGRVPSPTLFPSHLSQGLGPALCFLPLQSYITQQEVMAGLACLDPTVRGLMFKLPEIGDAESADAPDLSTALKSES